MDQVLLTVRDVPALADDARRYRFDCAHGSTWALVLPARSPRDDSAALVMLGARHAREVGCRCASTMPQPVGEPRWPQATA